MKNLTLKNTLACGLAVFLMSCEKESIMVTENQNNTPAEQNQRADEEEMLFLLNGEREIRMNDIEWTDETHFIYDYQGTNLAFDTDARLIDWASERDDRSEIIVKLEESKVQQAWAADNGYLDDEAATERYTQELIDALGGDRSAGILFNNQNYSGSILVMLLSYPTFGGFRNKAESLWMPATVGALCDKTWYRGAKFWFFAFPAGGIWTFNGFNNRAESNI